jgi:hypothetical protein
MTCASYGLTNAIKWKKKEMMEKRKKERKKERKTSDTLKHF